METDKHTFDRWRDSVKNNKSYNKEEHKDFAFSKDGMIVWYHKTEFKTKIKLHVNPSKVLELDDLIKLWKPNEKNIAESLTKLDELVDSYFNSEHEIEDFRLTRIDFTKNVRLDDEEKVSAYIKALYNIRKVKGFSPKYGRSEEWYDDDNSFDLEGNSNGVEFTAYDKAAALKNRKEKAERIEKAKGLLRLEVKLTTQKAIRSYTDEDNTVKRIIDLCKQSREIFMDTFLRVVPFGDLYKKDKVVKIIHENVTDKYLKRKMLLLLDLIPKKKSLHQAQKALNDRNIERILEEFYRHNVSPVTLSKRHKVKHLKSLYTFL